MVYPRKGLRVTVDVKLHSISCPGTWLPRRQDVYLSICLLGQYRRTALSSVCFPLVFHEKLRFQKVYFEVFDPSQVAELLEGEDILIELIQLSPIQEEGVLLASYENSARHFLFPAHSLYDVRNTRTVLMQRSIAFPTQGVSPKLEFTTKTSMKEVSELDLPANGELNTQLVEPDYFSQDEQLTERGTRRRSRSRSRNGNYSYEQPTFSSAVRASSPERPWQGHLEERPPFVVRKAKANLVARVPGCKVKRPKSILRNRSKSLNRYRTYTKPTTKVYREPQSDSDSDSEGIEPKFGATYRPKYEARPSRSRSRTLAVPRAVSPVYMTSPLARPTSPALGSLRRSHTADLIHDEVRRSIMRSRSPSPYYYRPRSHYDVGGTWDDVERLERDLRLTRLGLYRPLDYTY